MLNEEALARFQQFLPKNNFPVIYIINTMGWTRSGNAELFIDYEIMPPGKKVRIIDMSTGKEVPFQMLSKRAEGAYWVLQVSDIPAMGAKAMKVEVTEQKDLQPVSENSPSEILENNYYKIVIDRETGSIISLLDKELNLELADNQNRYHLGQLVHETLPGRNMLKPSQTSITNVRIVKGTEGQVWESVLILADMQGLKKGTTEKPEGAEIEIRLYRNTKKVELSYMARKEIVTDPEALYVAFPFFLPDSRIVFETIGGSLSQGSQLQGSSSDWNVAQNFVAVRGKKGQIVVVSNEIPLWQFSDFNIGKFERYPKPGKTWLYSWVMNNYWFTNFRAFQEGAFTWSYQITSSGDTSSTFATKYAWSERNPYLSRTLPAGGKLSAQPEIQTLKLSGSQNIITVNVRPVFNARGDILFHFRELEGIPSEIRITSAIPGRPVSKMFEVNALGQKAGEEINSIKFKPYEVKFIEVEF